ncbi:hypothetical protein [Ideonella sp.]|uniref:hypothetical protein n=1 Tax=Ideonella sp. TaxID=1929293 RepID=UPI0035AE57E9
MHAAFTTFSPARRWATLAALAGVALVLGCAPALDWREARIDGAGLAAMFPCRPVAQSRQIDLAGVAVTMTMHACEAADGTFAVSVADVKDPAAVGPVLSALKQASLAKLGRPVEPVAVADWRLAGATPQPAAGRWRLSSQRPDGAPLSVDTAVFARGTWVVQATVIGRQPDPKVNSPFFEGLQFAP